METIKTYALVVLQPIVDYCRVSFPDGADDKHDRTGPEFVHSFPWRNKVSMVVVNILLDQNIVYKIAVRL